MMSSFETSSPVHPRHEASLIAYASSCQAGARLLKVRLSRAAAVGVLFSPRGNDCSRAIPVGKQALLLRTAAATCLDKCRDRQSAEKRSAPEKLSHQYWHQIQHRSQKRI